VVNRCKGIFDLNEFKKLWQAALYGNCQPSDMKELGHCWTKKGRNCNKSAINGGKDDTLGPYLIRNLPHR